MAKKSPKIILYKEDVDGMGLASSALQSTNVIDALSVMQTDFIPQEDTVQVNSDGCFIACSLTDSESKKIANMPEVLDVIDDIEVTALQDDSYAGDSAYPLPLQEPDAADTEMLNSFLNASHLDEEPDQKRFDFLLNHKPSLTEDQIQIEHQLIDGTANAAANQLAASGITKEQLKKLIKCILKALAEKGKDASDINEEAITEALIREGITDANTVRAAADAILWNIRLIYAPQAWRLSKGAGVRVAVVDTGIANNHPDLQVYGGVSFVNGVTSWNDDNGHGTHVAGIIAAKDNGTGIVGVAPHARLYAVKVLNRNGSGSLSSVLNGLIWCGRARMHIVNLSLGSTPNPDSFSMSTFNRAYEHVGLLLRRRYGVLLVAAAGNRGGRPVSDPARCPSYLAVGAIDSGRRLAPFSSIGYQVELCAPGVNIISNFPPNGFRRLSGTSMAAPHVAGVAALVKARRPGLHPDSIRVHLWRTAIDLGWPGRDWAWGYGQVNAYRAVL